MNIDIILLLINTALAVLIWMVQLVIYPGFTYYSEAEVKKWHPIYTRKITSLVMPLMLAQLILYLFSILNTPSVGVITIMVLITFNWVITFLVAIPHHIAMDKKQFTWSERKKLININWYRTIAWSLILIISLIEYEA